MNNKSKMLIYKSTDNKINIECMFEECSVWLAQARRSVSTISEHTKNVYDEGELDEISTFRKFRKVQKESNLNILKTNTKFGNSEIALKPMNYYNLDLILDICYRVKSLIGTTFGVWINNIQNNLLQVKMIQKKRR